MPQINQPLLYVYTKLTNTHTHTTSVALPHDIFYISVRSTAPNSDCSLSDSINFLLPSKAGERHVRVNPTLQLLETHQIYLEAS